MDPTTPPQTNLEPPKGATKNTAFPTGLTQSFMFIWGGKLPMLDSTSLGTKPRMSCYKNILALFRERLKIP